jgi:hypothetical protein
MVAAATLRAGSVCPSVGVGGTRRPHLFLKTDQNISVFRHRTCSANDREGVKISFVLPMKFGGSLRRGRLCHPRAAGIIWRVHGEERDGVVVGCCSVCGALAGTRCRAARRRCPRAVTPFAATHHSTLPGRPRSRVAQEGRAHAPQGRGLWKEGCAGSCGADHGAQGVCVCVVCVCVLRVCV